MRPTWHKASMEDKASYRYTLEERLSLLAVPDSVRSCTDVHCHLPSHEEDLDQYTLEVLETVQEVAEACLPMPGVSKSRKGGAIVPGWKSEVRPYRDTAFFWHQIWVSCGRPLNTEVHNIMKKTRNIYHYQTESVGRPKTKSRRISY